jgi:hypothetical protein
VFEPADEPFDFSASDLALGEIERYVTSQGGLGGRQTLRRGIPVAFKKLQGLTEQPRSTKQSVRLVRKESPLTLSTCHRPARNVDEVGDTLERQRRVSTESLKRAVRQSLLHRPEKVEWIERLETKQDYVHVGSRSAASEVLPKSIEVLRRVSHQALYYGPLGRTNQTTLPVPLCTDGGQQRSHSGATL